MGFFSWVWNKLASAGAVISESIDQVKAYFGEDDKDRADIEYNYIDVPDIVIERLGEPLVKITKDLKYSAHKRAERTNKVFNLGLNGIKSWWDNFRVDVATALNGAWDGLNGLWDTIGVWRLNFENSITEVMTGVINTLNTIKDDVINDIMNFGEDVWKNMEGLGRYLDDVAHWLIDGVMSGLDTMIDNIINMDDNEEDEVVNEVEGWIGG